jgi:diguanylate cyclase (GGDEF)-like protein
MHYVLSSLLARFRVWLARGTTAFVFVSLGLASTAGLAQQDALEQVDAIYTLAEQNTLAALNQARTVTAEIGPQTPYIAQRELLRIRFYLEVETAQMDAAHITVRQLDELAKQHNDDVGLVLAAAQRSSLLTSTGKSVESIAQLTAVATIAQRMADPETLAYYYRVQGNAQLAVGQFEEALASCLKSLHFADQQKKHAPQARLNGLNNLSNVYSAMNNPEKALEIINQALALSNRLGLKSMLPSLYLNQGGAYSSLGRTAEYMAANELALKLSRESGQILTEAVVLNNMSDSWLINRDFVKAESFTRMAMHKYQETGDRSGASVAQANLGYALMGQGKVGEGAAQVRHSIKVQREAGDIANEEGILSELALMYERAGLYREAVATIREQQILSKQLFKADRERSVAALQEQFDAVQRQKQIELLARENSLKDYEIQNQRLLQVVTGLGAILTVIAGLFVYYHYRRARMANLKLREANKQLEFHSVRDALTGLFNRRSFLELMKKRPLDEASGRREDDSPDGLIVLDIDHFKSINDTLGHGAGDTVLVEVAKRLSAAVRESDMIIRWGGEEFLVYSPKAHNEHIESLASRILKTIGETPIEAGGRSISVTVSGGFLTLPFSGVPESQCNWEKALQIADMALYLGKVHGRNRAYGVTRLLVPFGESLPVLENDISAALSRGMIEITEVIGPAIDAAAPRLAPAE